MSKGILVFAFNNSHINYISQAIELSKRAKRHLNLPVSIVTDIEIQNSVFDNVIFYNLKSQNIKQYYDGSLSNKGLAFKNDARIAAYDLSPYEETLVLDTDFLIADDKLKYCFEQKHDFCILTNAIDIAGFRDTREFCHVSDKSVQFYWATIVFFRKTELNKIFFDLLNHIYENWYHYKQVYQIEGRTYRNDHAFSIAIHIMNGFVDNDFALPISGSVLYTTDRDILYKIDQDDFVFLIEKEKRLGEYTLVRTKNQSVHVMNKFSLDEALKNE